MSGDPSIHGDPLPRGLTFDDVLLLPQRSDLLPREVQLSTRFSRNVRLEIPLASAAIAGLWGLHPVNTAVAGLIHSKADLAYLAGALASWVLFARAERHRKKGQ